MPASSAPPGGSGRPGIPSAAADAEAELARLEAERDRLQGELKALTESISTREAVEDLIRTVERSPEPLALAGQKENPWVQSRAGVVSLCAVA